MQRAIIKVFLASPGDLIDERKAAKRIVEEENSNHAIPQGFQFELVGWEDTVAQHGRAQEVINRDLDQCDYFVGLLWKRWGSRPGPEGGQYSSGFEEEYERSQDRFQKTGKPEISLLFKSISSAETSDAGPQLEKVLKFKKDYTKEFRGIYHEFDDLRAFEERFRSIISMFLRQESSEETRIEAEESSKTPDADSQPQQGKADDGEMLFSRSAKDFVSDLFSRPADPKEYEYSALEAARLRLLGASLKLKENDELVVGVHDANILFREAKDIAFSVREVRNLLAAGINYYGAQNAPMWRWLWSGERSPLNELLFRTLLGPDHQRVNSFKILELFPDDLSGLEGPISRDDFVSWWLKKEESELLVASLTYLMRRGLPNDLEKIAPLLDSSEVTVSKAAVSAKISILARESAESALEFISTRDDADVPDKIADLVFSNTVALRTDAIRGCLSNQTIKFRRRVAQELLSRGDLSLEEGELLVQSSDAQTRLIGAYAIKSNSPSYSFSEAREHIVRPKNQRGLSLGSVPNIDFKGQYAFERYKHSTLCSRRQNELEMQLKKEGLYAHDITFALYDSYFSKFGDDLISNIEDGFVSFWEDRKMKGVNSDNRPEESTMQYLRGEIMQEAVELLVRKNHERALKVIRKAIDRGGIEYANGIVGFFEKKGDWEDVYRIVRLCENFPTPSISLFSAKDREDEYIISANAMLKLGKKRIGDLLAVPMPTQLWNAIIKVMSAASFKIFDDDRISAWLLSEVHSKRKSVALKSVICLPKARIGKILNSYISDNDTYYYNTVFWLDLGISTERSKSVKIAKEALSDL